MTSKRALFTITGAALAGSFLFSVAGGAAHPIHAGEAHTTSTFTDPVFPYAHLLIYLGGLLLMVGLPGAYVFLAPAVGRIGRAGLALYFVTNAIVVLGGLMFEGFVAPAIARDPAARHLLGPDGSLDSAGLFTALQTVGGLLFLVSWVLVGIGLYRGRLLPRGVGVLLVVGALLLFAPLPQVPVLTGLLIELPRGLAVGAVGLLMIRSVRRAPAAAEPALVAA